MKKTLSALALLLFASSSAIAAPHLTADQFIPVVQAPEEQREELRTVKAPEAIKQENLPGSQVQTLRAKTLQDALNFFLAKRMSGAMRIDTEDGNYGYVSTGIGIYNQDMKNINAVRISQRTAYLQALMDAKKSLTSYLNGAASLGFEVFRNSSDIANTSDSAENDSGTSMKNGRAEAVAGMLKGYVTYDVYDDGEATVYVTIACTPKTMSLFERPASDTLMSANLRDGMSAVLAEITSGLVPPVGGRIVDVPSTGEVAFVGFGSAIVQRAVKRSAVAQERRNAVRIAELRARSELMGIIAGDRVGGMTAFKEETKQYLGDDYSAVETMENTALDDPSDTNASEADKKKVSALKETFSHNRSFEEVVTTMRRGVIPPGVSTGSWADDDGWAYAYAVYVPSVTNQAATDAQKMAETQILKPVETEQEKEARKKLEEKEAEKESITRGPLYKDSGEYKRGVSGTVQQNL